MKYLERVVREKLNYAYSFAAKFSLKKPTVDLTDTLFTFLQKENSRQQFFFKCLLICFKQRFQQIASFYREKGLILNDPGERVLINKVQTITGLITLFNQGISEFLKTNKLKLIIIDSIAALIRY